MNDPPPARLLVVDDNRANRLILEKRLGAAGHTIVSAEDGTSALALLKPTLEGNAGEEAIDLAILDIMMPDIDGWEVLRRIRELKSSADFPIVMATAKDRTEDIVQALEAGANDYVVKPINIPILLARVDMQLSLRRARSALKNAQDSLIQNAKIESVGYLAAGVAHEIRNPLSRIKMGLQGLSLNKAVMEDEKLGKTLDAMRSACETADEVVRGLMKVSTETRPEVEDLSVEAVLNEALLVLGGPLDDHHITLDLDLEHPPPRARAAFTELRQVILSVLLNAIQAMPDGGTLTIRSSERVIEDLPEKEGRTGNMPRIGDKMVALEIEDTGPGLAKDKLEAAFDAFYTTKATGTATGLGLTIARKTLDLLGGFISLENREQGGLRVTILLPKAGSFRTTV